METKDLTLSTPKTKLTAVRRSAKELVKIAAQSKKKSQECNHEKRLKLVNSLRSPTLNEGEETSTDENFEKITVNMCNLFDAVDSVEKEGDKTVQADDITLNDEILERKLVGDEYVYDLYYADQHNLGNYFENCVSIQPFQYTGELAHEDCKDSEDELTDSSEDDEDSYQMRGDRRLRFEEECFGPELDEIEASMYQMSLKSSAKVNHDSDSDVSDEEEFN
ncbi:hypothetical protein GQR58_023243 [Nymphon striatum]|nr:hypothetical protein GQR58_023243 [Nymphon striatum]